MTPGRAAGRPPVEPRTAERSNGAGLDGLADALAEAVALRVVESLRAELAAAVEPAGYLGVEQAAAYLAASPQRVYDLVHEGRLRCAKDGRRSLFRREWLDACLEGPE